jgi:hypothetical protein
MNADFINLVPTAFFGIVFGLLIGRPRALSFLSARVQRVHGLLGSVAFDLCFLIIFAFVFFWLVLSALTFLYEIPVCAL